MVYKGKASELLHLEVLHANNTHILTESVPSGLTILWLKGKQTRLRIDGLEYTFSGNQIICLAEFHKLQVMQLDEARLIRFNRSFYCIRDHDQEVSCKGLLFYNSTQIPVISIPTQEREKYELLWRMFSLEMETQDNLQLEMLQMMLKRLIIICTRLFKEQNHHFDLQVTSLNLVRDFNYLVEVHFRDKHTVSEYASLLNKSAKSITNLFARHNQKTPLQVIQDRIILEARRQLWYTDKPVKEIAFAIGFSDIQAFSRFFKSKEGLGPREFRDQKSSKEKLTTNRENKPTH